MLYANNGCAPRAVLSTGPHADAGQAPVWLDVLNGTEAERALVERLTRLPLPDRDALSEVESSSRLNADGQVLRLSTPMAYRGADGASHVAPLGFVLSPDHLVTLRFSELPVFDSFAEIFDRGGRGASSLHALAGLLEAMVDRQADVLERMGGELDTISRDVFRVPGGKNSQDARLQEVLRSVGRKADTLSNLRDSLLGVSRLLPFVEDMTEGWMPQDLRPRFRTLRHDVQSLADYDNQLADKVQFLLDATLGFINIEQNNGIKVLTVVSVVGVPPTLVASIYGMNFKWIPELQWDYGYFYGLAVIVLSAVVPLLWFKRRGWI